MVILTCNERKTLLVKKKKILIYIPLKINGSASLNLKMEDDWAFNSLPHFICKINLAKLLFTCSTETCEEMLCTAGESVTVQESMLNVSQEEEKPSA